MKLHPIMATQSRRVSRHPSSLASRRVDISDAPRMLAFAHNVPLSMCTPAPRASPLSEPLQGKMILAPLTRGGNLPFRRLCVDYGMEVSFGEMVYARNLLKEAQRGRNGPEQARLRRAPNEQFFGVQIATNDIEEGLAAAKIVAESGADFIDLNCGCPIYEATRRNLGSALLRNPERLASLVEGLAGGSSLPVSVKVRLAAMGGEVNINEVAGALYEAGAAALTIHGRTASDRYTKAADWAVIACVVDDCRARGGGNPNPDPDPDPDPDPNPNPDPNPLGSAVRGVRAFGGIRPPGVAPHARRHRAWRRRRRRRPGCKPGRAPQGGGCPAHLQRSRGGGGRVRWLRRRRRAAMGAAAALTLVLHAGCAQLLGRREQRGGDEPRAGVGHPPPLHP